MTVRARIEACAGPTMERSLRFLCLTQAMIPVARRTLRESHDLTLSMRGLYAHSLYSDPGATLDDLREAETTLVETERTARRILGSAHPLVDTVEQGMRDFRELRAIHELRASMK